MRKNRISPWTASRHFRSNRQDDMCDSGCTRAQLIKHIEDQFLLGMTWENYGKVWQIDHITPAARFNLFKMADFYACAHFSNLRPLWKRENIKKSSLVAGVRFRHTKRTEPWVDKWEFEESFKQLKCTTDCLRLETRDDANEYIQWGRSRGMILRSKKCDDGFVRVWKIGEKTK